TYEVQVAAENAAGIGAYAPAPAVQATPRTTPGAPQDLKASADNAALAITIIWKAPDNDGGARITGYRYRWSNDGDDSDWESAGGANGAEIAGGPSARTHTIDTALERGKTYRIQVAAVNTAGGDKWSSAADATLYAFDLDVDNSGAVNAADGVMVARYLLGVSGDSLVHGQADPAKAGDIAAKLAAGRAGKALDVDGDGDVDGDDGILVARYLLGLRGDALVASFPQADADDVRKKIEELQPSAE
ncbi:MAG: fibronectin type III domain-containing protein, partial [Gammaproteobacteria bacterium]